MRVCVCHLYFRYFRTYLAAIKTLFWKSPVNIKSGHDFTFIPACNPSLQLSTREPSDVGKPFVNKKTSNTLSSASLQALGNCLSSDESANGSTDDTDITASDTSSRTADAVFGDQLNSRVKVPEPYLERCALVPNKDKNL